MAAISIPLCPQDVTTFIDDFLETEPYYIYTQDDADYLSRNNCTTAATSLIISPNSTSIITLNGFQRVAGNLVLQSSASLTNFSAPDLQRIEGNFTLDSLSNLSELNFPELQVVGGMALWYAVPLVTSWDFPQASTAYLALRGVNISGTGLSEFIMNDSNSNSYFPDKFYFVNNSKLKVVNLTTNEPNDDTYGPTIMVSGNAPDTVVHLSGINFTNNLHFENCQDIIFDTRNAQSLTLLNNSMTEFGSNITIEWNLIIQSNEELSQVDLPHVGYEQSYGMLTAVFQNNPKLEQVKLPNLTSVNKFVMQDNAPLYNLSNLASLQVTNLTLIGNFSE